MALAKLPNTLFLWDFQMRPIIQLSHIIQHGKIYKIWELSPEIRWSIPSGKWQHRVLVQDGDMGRPQTHLIHKHTKSTPTYRAVPPAEELRADWTASAHQKVDHREKSKRNSDMVRMGTPPQHCKPQRKWIPPRDLGPRTKKFWFKRPTRK